MADEVKPIEWGRIREWDGSKGCPPVAVGWPCAIYERGWAGLRRSVSGAGGTWAKEVTAYRIPKQFDHLDDNGNPIDPFAGYTSAELRAAADAKDAAEAEELQPWLGILAEIMREAGFTEWADTIIAAPDHEDATLARRLREGCAKLSAVCFKSPEEVFRDQ